jgi:lipid-binding SYLF domain-containing protein
VVEATEEAMSFTRTIALLAALFAGCATAPSTRAEQQSLQASARATLDEMIAQDARIQDPVHNAPAYAVFPSIAKGGVFVGGAHGRGILYEHGVPTGFVAVEQAAIGAMLGGQSFSELLVLRTPDDLASVKSGNFTAGAHLGIVVLSASAGTQTNFNPNASIFVMPRGGLMVDVSISGQRIKYQPLSA